MAGDGVVPLTFRGSASGLWIAELLDRPEAAGVSTNGVRASVADERVTAIVVRGVATAVDPDAHPELTIGTPAPAAILEQLFGLAAPLLACHAMPGAVVPSELHAAHEKTLVQLAVHYARLSEHPDRFAALATDWHAAAFQLLSGQPD